MSTDTAERQLLAIPYWIAKDQLDKNLPALIYRRLAAEDILPDLFHERFMGEEDFVAFFTNSDLTLSFVFMDMANGKFLGCAWLTDLAITDCFTKGQGAFAFFKEYWDPKITEFCGRAFLEQVFFIANVDLVWGVTPASNRLAQVYCKRLGFKYEATLQGMTCRRGEITDAMICVLRKTEYQPKE